MEFHLLRFSLKSADQIDLFEKRNSSGRSYTREEWLRDFFKGRRSFFHRQSQFYIVPEERSDFPPRLIFGWLTREKMLRERTSPDQGFEIVDHPSWREAFFILDPSHHPDGQKIAIEYNNDIGQPTAISKSIANAMNNLEGAPFYVQVHPIVRSGAFWAFLEENGGEIKSIGFDVAVPNMFSGRDDFQREMRELRDRNNASRVSTSIESDSLLNCKEENISDIIDYTEQGGGKLTAVAKNEKKYNSEDSIEKISADIDRQSKGTNSFFRGVREILDRIF